MTCILPHHEQMSWAEGAAWLSCCTGRAYSAADAQALLDEPWFQEARQSRGDEWLKQAFTTFGWVVSAPFTWVQKEARRQWEASQERGRRIDEEWLADEIELGFGLDARSKFEEVRFHVAQLHLAQSCDPHVLLTAAASPLVWACRRWLYAFASSKMRGRSIPTTAATSASSWPSEQRPLTVGE